MENNFEIDCIASVNEAFRKREKQTWDAVFFPTMKCLADYCTLNCWLILNQNGAGPVGFA